MDAHAFRIIGRELLSLLEGARVEKIHGPEANVLVFRLFSQGLKFSLLFRFERQNPLLLITRNPPENPFTPSAFVMRLRKYVNNRRLSQGALDWQNRRMAFAIPGAGDDPLWLLLDLRQGASLCAELPPDFSSEPLWPEPELIDSLCREVPEAKRPESAFVGYPVLTPLLRSSLGYMEALDGRALLIDLETDNDYLFAYTGRFVKKGPAAPSTLPNNTALKLISAWPLPDDLLEKMSIELTTELPQSDLTLEALAPKYKSLFLASALGEQNFYQGRFEKRRSDLEKPERKEEKRLKRLLRNLELEEGRLQKMREQRHSALILQQNLWRIESDGHFERLSIPRPSLSPSDLQPETFFGTSQNESPGDYDVVELDVRLTVLENMKKMFKQSERAARGLAMLHERKAAAVAEFERAAKQVAAIKQVTGGRFMPGRVVSESAADIPGGEATSTSELISDLVSTATPEPSAGDLKCRFFTAPKQAEPMQVWDTAPGLADSRLTRPASMKTPGKDGRKKQNPPGSKQGPRGLGSLPKDIARFVSSDGFVMLRGKNAQGNHQLLRVGSPFDLWFHAENGPSAHLIIRRSHAKEAIPERTMFEAGCLTALKSSQRTQDKVRVMCALLSDVQPIKGAPAGTVRVSKVEMTMLVDLEPEMETLLSAPGHEKT